MAQITVRTPNEEAEQIAGMMMFQLLQNLNDLNKVDFLHNALDENDQDLVGMLDLAFEAWKGKYNGKS